MTYPGQDNDFTGGGASTEGLTLAEELALSFDQEQPQTEVTSSEIIPEGAQVQRVDGIILYFLSMWSSN